MTAPILIRRRRTNGPPGSFRARLVAQWPWSWTCQTPDGSAWSGAEATWAEARDEALAHLAHLATHAIPPSRNAEDCPRCTGANLPYPWICPGHPAPDARHTPLHVERWAPPPCA